MRIFSIIFMSILLISCGTTEEGVESGQPEEISEAGPEINEDLLPGWYSMGKLGEAADGSLNGYAISMGSDSDWAYENAKRQASVNLRVWIDDQLEEARSVVAENEDSASDREFILQLRNAVSGLDFDDSTADREEFEGEENTLHVVVRIEASSDSVLGELEQKLVNYSAIWNQMKETAPLSDW